MTIQAGIQGMCMRVNSGDANYLAAVRLIQNGVRAWKWRGHVRAELAFLERRRKKNAS